MRRFLTTGEIADAFSVSKATVRRWVHNGFLPAFRLGKARGWAVDQEEFEKLVALKKGEKIEAQKFPSARGKRRG